MSDPGGSVYEHKLVTTRAFSPAVASNVTAALHAVVESGTGQRALALRPTRGRQDGHRDRRLMPHLPGACLVVVVRRLHPTAAATAVAYTRGTGNEALDGYLDTYFGADYPTETWTAYTSAALQGRRIVDFPPAGDLNATPPTPTYVSPTNTVPTHTTPTSADDADHSDNAHHSDKRPPRRPLRQRPPRRRHPPRRTTPTQTVAESEHRAHEDQADKPQHSGRSDPGLRCPAAPAARLDRRSRTGPARRGARGHEGTIGRRGVPGADANDGRRRRSDALADPLRAGRQRSRVRTPRQTCPDRSKLVDGLAGHAADRHVRLRRRGDPEVAMR